MGRLGAVVFDVVEYMTGSTRCAEADAPCGPMQAPGSDRPKNRENLITYLVSIACIMVERCGFSTPRGLGLTLIREEEENLPYF
jgi:hypothetical protein